MSSLSIEAVRALAAICIPTLHDPGKDATLRDIVVGLGLYESGLIAEAEHLNRNGTIDRGMLQVNSENLARVGLTPQTALIPCNSLRAGAQIFLSGLSTYNSGSPTKSLANYAPGAVEAIRRVRDGSGKSTDNARPARPQIEEVGQECAAPKWDVWAQEDCTEDASLTLHEADNAHE